MLSPTLRHWRRCQFDRRHGLPIFVDDSLAAAVIGTPITGWLAKRSNGVIMFWMSVLGHVSGRRIDDPSPMSEIIA
jgi:hypothetical protein